MRLQGKAAVVLGASAEGGTGWRIAEKLAEEGCRVVVAARTFEPLEVLAARIGGKAIVCDAGDPEQIANLARGAFDAFGSIDVAVNSAAIPVTGLIAETSVASVRKSVEVNYIGQFCFVQEMAKLMQNGGSITLISSSSSAQPVLPFFPYACAKAATDSLVRYAALEYGKENIRVNSILPGPIKTPMATKIFEAPGADEVFRKEIALQRVGTPEDFARTIIALAELDYITGVNLPVSGGMHLTRSPRQDEMPGADVFEQQAPH